MTSIQALPICVLLLTCGYTTGYSQTTRATAGQGGASVEEPAKQQDAPVIIHLAQGGQLEVDEVSEDADGVWYKRGSISTFLDRTKVRRIERPAPPAAATDPTPIKGEGKWHLADASKVKEFFQSAFNRPLPLTAFGQSELHDRWGWDHRNGMDVGLHPDSAEGRALITFLRSQSIPFLAFRGPIPGVATGPHIHVGNRSPRLNLR